MSTLECFPLDIDGKESSGRMLSRDYPKKPGHESTPGILALDEATRCQPDHALSVSSKVLERLEKMFLSIEEICLSAQECDDTRVCGHRFRCAIKR